MRIGPDPTVHCIRQCLRTNSTRSTDDVISASGVAGEAVGWLLVRDIDDLSPTLLRRHDRTLGQHPFRALLGRIRRQPQNFPSPDMLAKKNYKFLVLLQWAKGLGFGSNEARFRSLIHTKELLR